MNSLPDDLRRVLDDALGQFRSDEIAATVQDLIAQYRAPEGVRSSVLRSDRDVAAYAAYRMPATYAAVRSAMQALAHVAPGFSPTSQIDLGGGTGAAVWAAVDIWPSLTEIQIVERERTAIALGSRLTSASTSAALRAAKWQQRDVAATAPAQAHLVTMSYMLGELPEATRDKLLLRWAKNAGALMVIEPGTKAGYERVVAARDLLIANGFAIAAPCPHQSACPIPRNEDWCHFAARVSRSSLHRRAKSATLGHEDEKFSYVVAMPEAASQTAGRVLRHPQKRKGLVSLRLCGADGALADVAVSQRDGDLYRAARDVEWGDAWPPA